MEPGPAWKSRSRSPRAKHALCPPWRPDYLCLPSGSSYEEFCRAYPNDRGDDYKAWLTRHIEIAQQAGLNSSYRLGCEFPVIDVSKQDATVPVNLEATDTEHKDTPTDDYSTRTQYADTQIESGSDDDTVTEISGHWMPPASGQPLQECPLLKMITDPEKPDTPQDSQDTYEERRRGLTIQAARLPKPISEPEPDWASSPDFISAVNMSLSDSLDESWFDLGLLPSAQRLPFNFQGRLHDIVNYINATIVGRHEFYKIGITENPLMRWSREDCGYGHPEEHRICKTTGLPWRKMYLLYVAPTSKPRVKKSSDDFTARYRQYWKPGSGTYITCPDFYTGKMEKDMGAQRKQI